MIGGRLYCGFGSKCQVDFGRINFDLFLQASDLTCGGISKQFRDLEVCFEISPAGRVSQEQVEINSRKKETAVTGPLAAGHPASACMQNSEFMHA